VIYTISKFTDALYSALEVPLAIPASDLPLAQRKFSEPKFDRASGVFAF
jgi:hypothetical protein